jgi:hypothetical protein
MALLTIKPKIYLDTTVPSAYFDERSPERQALTAAFWEERMPLFFPHVSQVVIREVDRTPDPDHRQRMLQLLEPIDELGFEPFAARLAEEYMRNRIFPARSFNDARHVAVAVTNRIGYRISWNFRHLVKIATRREVNLINSRLGLSPIEILAPPEL